MTDLDRLLSDAFDDAAGSYRPPDAGPAAGEFVRRRRRRRNLYATGAAAAAAGAAAAAAFLAGAVMDRDPGVPPAASRPDLEVVAEIPVGRNPSGISIGADSVWVANVGDGTVSRIDPRSDEVVAEVDVGGRPDDVVAGDDVVWVTDVANGRVTPVFADGNRPGEPVEVSDGSKHLDVDLGRDALWVAVADTEIVAIDLDTGARRRLDIPATDVAAGDEIVWFLDSHDGRVGAIDAATGEIVYDSPDGYVGGGGGGDLAAGGGRLWATRGRGGVVFALDPGAEAARPAVLAIQRLGGTYAGIAADGSSVWVVSGASNGVGRLTRLDASSAEIAGRQLVIFGVPHDVAVGLGSAWVTDNAGGRVLRVDATSGTDAGGAGGSGRCEGCAGRNRAPAAPDS